MADRCITDPYLKRWDLVPDGPAVVTRSGCLQPVLGGGAPAMLKIATSAEEKRGAGLMIWWQGRGAARVLNHDAEAILLERPWGLDP